MKTFSIRSVSYVPQVTDWTNTIVDNCIKELQSLNKPYKYIITCLIMQKNGAGVNTCASMVWDPTKDNFCQVCDEGLPLSTHNVTQRVNYSNV